MDTNEIRGKSKSGRVWRDVRRKRYSANKQPKGVKKTFSQRMAIKSQLNKRREEDIKRKTARNEDKKLKRLQEEEKKKRRAENIKKAEVVVPINNMAKIKKMKKSQLKTISMR